MHKIILLSLLILACNHESTNCPPGAFIDEWQVISDSKSTYKLDCVTQIHLKLTDHSSVWISSTKYRHDAGVAMLSAVVMGCESSRVVVMTVGTTTRPATQSGDYYLLAADVADPWLVAIGVESEIACEATINRIEYQLTPHSDMTSPSLTDMSMPQDMSVTDDLNTTDLD